LFNLEERLLSIAADLDIPPALHEQAISYYDDVAEWLSQEGSPLRDLSPTIYPQGSFRLGTVVRPLRGNGEFDVDVVCRLNITKEQTTQAELKKKVGSRLRASPEFAKILEECRRCWTLQYKPHLHLDVLPAMPDPDSVPDSILLTDKELRFWQHSNPIGYAEWFFASMQRVLREAQEALAKSAGVNVEDIPDWRVRTPLQRAVQILKRHRDVYFQTDDDSRPVSIIITTLAARAYAGHTNIADALAAITSEMPRFIENRNGKWWVENPAHSGENFADKWNEKAERRLAFLAWLKKVRGDFETARLAKSFEAEDRILSESLAVPRRAGAANSSTSVVLRESVPVLASAAHAAAPQWQQRLDYKCKLTADLYKENRRARALWKLTDRPVPKNHSLRFEVETNVPGPYEVQWQVINTGQEAMTVGDPRGGFYTSNDGARRRWETTRYAGTHLIEAFVIKAGVCVARSGRRHVKIKT